MFNLDFSKRFNGLLCLLERLPYVRAKPPIFRLNVLKGISQAVSSPVSYVGTGGLPVETGYNCSDVSSVKLRVNANLIGTGIDYLRGSSPKRINDL